MTKEKALPVPLLQARLAGEYGNARRFTLLSLQEHYPANHTNSKACVRGNRVKEGQRARMMALHSSSAPYQLCASISSTKNWDNSHLCSWPIMKIQ